MNTELYRCLACGREMTLPVGRHWCPCNPGAPFRMAPVSVLEAIDAMFASIAEKQRRLAAIRDVKKLK